MGKVHRAFNVDFCQPCSWVRKSETPLIVVLKREASLRVFNIQHNLHIVWWICSLYLPTASPWQLLPWCYSTALMWDMMNICLANDCWNMYYAMGNCMKPLWQGPIFSQDHSQDYFMQRVNPGTSMALKANTEFFAWRPKQWPLILTI